MSDLIPAPLEIRKGREVGYKNANTKYIWRPCAVCGKYGWTAYNVRRKEPRFLKCRVCAMRIGQKLRAYSFAPRLNDKGYILLYIYSDDPYFAMAHPTGQRGRKNRGTWKCGGYVREHRYVMAQHLGRCLEAHEIVHHVNGIRDDNRIENLSIRTNHNHAVSYKEAYNTGYMDGLKARDKQLEKEIRLLQWQIKEISIQLQIKFKEVE